MMKEMVIQDLRIRENVEKVWNLVHSGKRLNIKAVAGQLNWRKNYLHRKKAFWPNDWILHHDYAPAHKELSVKQSRAQKSTAEVEHPPCFPDLVPNDFGCFQK